MARKIKRRLDEDKDLFRYNKSCTGSLMYSVMRGMKTIVDKTVEKLLKNKLDCRLLIAFLAKI